MFKNRTLLVATMHEKEKVLAPVFEEALGVTCVVAKDFDTDVLGTFTGEVNREDDPITTLRKKCNLAMEMYTCDLVVGSEGSFGPHPSLYFVHANDELVLLIDKKNNLEIFARELTTDTNFNGAEVSTESQLLEFATKAKFPSHALILRKSKDVYTHITKGITDVEFLKKILNHLIDNYGIAYVETDMRAMYNPTRMTVIEKAAQKLVDKINSKCPQCSHPGFSITGAKPGLLCNLCGSTTRSTLSYIFTCQKCSYNKEQMYPHNKTLEDPMFCDYCNP